MRRGLTPKNRYLKTGAFGAQTLGSIAEHGRCSIPLWKPTEQELKELSKRIDAAAKAVSGRVDWRTPLEAKKTSRQIMRIVVKFPVGQQGSLLKPWAFLPMACFPFDSGETAARMEEALNDGMLAMDKLTTGAPQALAVQMMGVSQIPLDIFKT